MRRPEHHRRSLPRPHPHPSEPEDQQRRTRRRLSNDESPQRTGLDGSDEAASTDDNPTRTQSTHGIRQSLHRAPAMEAYPPPGFPLLVTPEQRIRELRLASQAQPFPPGNFSQGSEVSPAGFQSLNPFEGTPLGNNSTVGLGYPYMATSGPVTIHSPAGLGTTSSFPTPPAHSPSSSMQPNDTNPSQGSMNPTRTASVSPSPDRVHATEGATTYEPNITTHQGTTNRPRNRNEETASTRGRMW